MGADGMLIIQPLFFPFFLRGVAVAPPPIRSCGISCIEEAFGAGGPKAMQRSRAMPNTLQGRKRSPAGRLAVAQAIDDCPRDGWSGSDDTGNDCDGELVHEPHVWQACDARAARAEPIAQPASASRDWICKYPRALLCQACYGKSSDP